MSIPRLGEVAVQLRESARQAAHLAKAQRKEGGGPNVAYWDELAAARNRAADLVEKDLAKPVPKPRKPPLADIGPITVKADPNLLSPTNGANPNRKANHA